MRENQHNELEVSLGTFLMPVLKWWWLILLTTLVAALSSYYMLSQRPAMYRVQSSLILGQSLSNPNLDIAGVAAASQLAQTYVEAAKRQPVRTATMENLGLDWLPEYQVRPIPSTQLIEIIVNDTVPERALATNQELVNQLILLSPSGSRAINPERQAAVDEMLSRYEQGIQETIVEGEELAAQMMEVVSAKEIEDLEQQLAAVQSKLTRLEGTYAYFISQSSQEANNAIQVFEKPTLPTTPVSDRLAYSLLASAAVGFALGVAAAYLLEYLDDTLKSADDTTHVSGLPVLASVAEIASDGKKERVLVAAEQPRSQVTEVFRTLRTSIQYSNLDRQVSTLVVTSPVPADGKSTIAANLGVVMTQAGQKALIIDTDLRRPVLHKVFNTRNNFGLTNMLVRMQFQEDERLNEELFDVLLQQSLKRVTDSGLMLLTSGPIPPNPAEMLGSAKMKWFVEAFRQRFDITIFDTPPCLPVTDAVIMSTRTDGVLLVAREGKTRYQHLKKAIARFDEVNANMTGIVLNRVSEKELDYYYGNYYASDQKEERRRKLGRNKQPIGDPKA